MRTIQADILDIQKGMIVHQVNCRHVAGAGLAKAIAKRHPGWYTFFRQSEAVLGNATFYKVGDLVIASLYAQYSYGRTGRHTNYAAFGHAIFIASQYAYDHDLEAYIPYKIGCGLGGGDWSIIEKIIYDAFPVVTIVRRP